VARIRHPVAPSPESPARSRSISVGCSFGVSCRVVPSSAPARSPISHPRGASTLPRKASPSPCRISRERDLSPPSPRTHVYDRSPMDWQEFESVFTGQQISGNRDLRGHRDRSWCAAGVVLGPQAPTRCGAAGRHEPVYGEAGRPHRSVGSHRHLDCVGIEHSWPRHRLVRCLPGAGVGDLQFRLETARAELRDQRPDRITTGRSALATTSPSTMSQAK
jgi:hypothetical protein